MGQFFAVQVFEAGILPWEYPMTNIDPLMRAVSPQQFSVLLTFFKEVMNLFPFCEMSQ